MVRLYRYINMTENSQVTDSPPNKRIQVFSNVELSHENEDMRKLSRKILAVLKVNPVFSQILPHRQTPCTCSTPHAPPAFHIPHK